MLQIIDWVSPRGIMRLLVISYFLAMALGWVGGTEVIDFMLPILPDDIAKWLMQGLVFGLSLLILAGIGRRHAALVLALVVFFSSYTSLYTGGDIGAFWRDLALIGALLMTADFSSLRDKEIDWTPEQADEERARISSKPQETSLAPLDDKQFRKDFDIARAS